MTHVPCSRNTKVGVGYPFDVPTHCGVTNAFFAGRIWVPTRRVGSGGNPPKWMNNPFQRGRIMLTSRTRALFTSEGHTIEFHPAPKNFRVERCE